MESKFHRWWLGSCVAALLLASWAGGFSVAVTAVFVVIYLTGVTLVGPEDEADIGLTSVQESAKKPEPEVAPEVAPKPEAKAAKVTAVVVAPAITADDDDAEPYPDDEAEAEPPREAPADAVLIEAETSDGADTAAVLVETPDDVDGGAADVVGDEPDSESLSEQQDR